MIAQVFAERCEIGPGLETFAQGFEATTTL